MTADINLDRLERELEQAVEADRRYWEKNDAKFRAVHQRVASYEEFKEIVNASHLKPLDRGERVTEIRTTEAGLWNRGRSRGSGAASGADNKAALPLPAAQSGEPPATSQQFLRQWRSLKAAKDRSAYLLSLAPSVYATLFASEVPFGLLGEFMTALDDFSSSEDVDWSVETTLGILTALTECQRFHLAVAFFSQSERLAAQRLMQRLAEAAATAAGGGDEADKPDEQVEKLRAVYSASST